MPENPILSLTPAPPADAEAVRYYYLRNFQFALAWLGERYGGLFDAQELAFLSGFGGLPRASQALLVRMLMRKGPLFRSSALVYEEIGCPLAASQPLVQAGWVDDDPVLAFDDAVRLLRREEVAALLAARAAGADGAAGCGDPARAAKGWTKARMVEVLRQHDPQPAPWRRWQGNPGDVLLDVRVAALVERLRLMFFGNLRQDWSEFVLADLGIFQYERVPFERSSRAFEQRSDVDAYLRLHALRQRFDEGAPAADLLPQAMAEDCATAWVRRRRDKLLFGIGRQLEREQCWDEALQAYGAGSHTQARHRALRVLELRGQHDAALAAALDAAAAPRDDAEAQLLQRLLLRLQRALGHTPGPVKRTPAAPVIVLDVPPPANPQRVELLAGAHLAQTDAPVFYVENALVNSLFGLLCWQALFMAMPGAFFHPFQRGPADLYFPEFVPMRAQAFDACLARLDDGSYRDAIRANFSDKAGLQSPFVYWGAIDEVLLDTALRCVPAAHLKLWFRRILADIRTNSNGLPDLIQFWPAEQRYELIEVKGPGDRLQDNQRRWMAYNIAHGIPVKVCHVRWAEQAA